MARQAVIKLYMHLTGGVDSGLSELDVPNYWRKHSTSGDKILAFASVDAKNHTHVQQAIQLFGGVVGFQGAKELPSGVRRASALDAGPADQRRPRGLCGWVRSHGVTVLTWGNTQRGTWDWWDECVDEAYAILPPEAQQSEFAPSFDLAQLKADLGEVAV
jgi:hypothetical protein